MTDATMSDINILPSSPIAPAAPSCSVDGPASLGKHRHDKHHSQPITCPSTPPSVIAYPLTPAIPPLIRPNLTLDTLDTTEPFSSHPAELPSPVPTEITMDLPVVELTPEECMERLRAEGIKVHDFAYKPLPNLRKAPEVSDPIPLVFVAFFSKTYVQTLEMGK